QLLDRVLVDLAEPVAGRFVEGSGTHLLEQLLDHGADPHDLGRLLDHGAHSLLLGVLAGLGDPRHAHRSTVRTDDHDLLVASVPVLLLRWLAHHTTVYRAGSAQGQQDLPDHAARLQSGVRLGGIRQWDAVVDDGPNATVGDHRPHLLAHAGDDRRLAARPVHRTTPQLQGGDAAALAHQLVEVDLALGAALQADDQQPAVGGERIDVRGEPLGAHDVEDDVCAVPVGGLLQAGRDVVVVVDHDVRAELAAALQALRGARGGGHPGAQRLGHLDRVGA